VATRGAISLIVEYYGTGGAQPITRPLPTVTTRDRFALIRAQGGDVLFRMLKPRELAGAQGFRTAAVEKGEAGDARASGFFERGEIGLGEKCKEEKGSHFFDGGGEKTTRTTRLPWFPSRPRRPSPTPLPCSTTTTRPASRSAASR
jgi:hypothetical protein